MKLNLYRGKEISEIVLSVFLFCIIVPLIKPDGINSINSTLSNFIWGYGQYVAGIVCAILFLFTFIKRRKLSIIGTITLVFLFASFLITYWQGGSIQYWYINYSNAVYIVFIFEVFQDRIPMLIGVILTYLKILLYINLICMILYPNGMYYTQVMNYSLNWFLGYKSSLQYYIIPAIAFGWIEANYLNKKKRFTVLLLVCAIETVIAQNTMLLVVLALLLICFFFKIYKSYKIFNGITYVFGGVIFNLAVVFYLAVIVQSELGRMLFDFLGKDITLSGRANIIWPRALYFIKQELLLGYGVVNADKHVNMLGMSAAIHAHNQILEILLCGGIALLAFFLILLIVVAAKLKASNHLAVAQTLGLCIFAILIMVSVEVFTRGCGSGIWLVFLLTGVLQQVEQQYISNYGDMRDKHKRIKIHVK